MAPAKENETVTLADQVGKADPLVEDDHSEVDDSEAMRTYLQYNRLKDDGVPKSKSILGKFADEEMEKEEPKDEEEEEEEPKEPQKKPEEQKKPDEKKPDEEEDDVKSLLGLDESTLTNARGEKITKETGKTIKMFKKTLERLNKENEELKARGTQDPELTEKLSKLEKENLELKNQMDSEYFEKSDAYKQAYVVPIQEKAKAIEEYFTDVKDKEELRQLNESWIKAERLAVKGDRLGFMKLADQIAEQFLEGGASISAAYAAEVRDYYTLIQDHNKISTEKGEDRKKIIASKLEGMRKQNLASTDRAIERHVDVFKANKRVVLDNLDDKTRKEYLETFEVPASKAKAAITDFMITGKINEDLEIIIQDGVTAKANQYESNLAWAAYKDVTNKASILEKENKELKEQIDKLSGNKGKDRGSYQSDQTKGDYSDRKQRKPGQSIIGGFLNV